MGYNSTDLKYLSKITVIYNKLGFKNCINDAFNIGFRQQSFIIVKDYTKLQFWLTDISLQNDDEKYIDFTKIIILARKKRILMRIFIL